MEEHQMMNLPQKKYFCKRIDEIAMTAINEFEQCEGDMPSLVQIRTNAILQGDVPLLKESAQIKTIVANLKENHYWGDSWGSISITDILNKSKASKIDKAYNDQKDAMRGDVQKQINKINAESTRIKDEAMFGSASQAQIMLAEFIKWVK